MNLKRVVGSVGSLVTGGISVMDRYLSVSGWSSRVSLGPHRLEDLVPPYFFLLLVNTFRIFVHPTPLDEKHLSTYRHYIFV